MPAPSHRRDFVRTLTLGATAGLLARPAPAREDQSEEDEVEARMTLILARYGDQLDEEARQAIRGDVEGVVRRGQRLRQFALDNGDGPIPIFVPYRKPLA